MHKTGLDCAYVINAICLVNLHMYTRAHARIGCINFTWHMKALSEPGMHEFMTVAAKQCNFGLPTQTFPILLYPSLQVHVNEPMLFVQVECSGHVSLKRHSSTSAFKVVVDRCKHTVVSFYLRKGR